MDMKKAFEKIDSTDQKELERLWRSMYSNTGKSQTSIIPPEQLKKILEGMRNSYLIKPGSRGEKKYAKDIFDIELLRDYQKAAEEAGKVFRAFKGYFRTNLEKRVDRKKDPGLYKKAVNEFDRMAANINAVIEIYRSFLSDVEDFVKKVKKDYSKTLDELARATEGGIAEWKEYSLSGLGRKGVAKAINRGYEFVKRVFDGVERAYVEFMSGRLPEVRKILTDLEEEAIATAAVVMTYRPLIKSNEEVTGGYTD